MATKTMSKQEILKQIKLEEMKIKQAESRKELYVLKTTSPVVKKNTSANNRNVSRVKTTNNSPKRQKSKSSALSSPSNPSSWDSVFQQPKQKPIPPSYVSQANQKSQLQPVAKNESKLDSKLVAETKPVSQVEESKPVGKLFYAISINSGLLLICAVVVIMIGIASDWTFWI